jgi:hypothetical protein
MSSIFGWDLPPGCTQKQIDDLFAEGPCDICGKDVDHCICPECPVCGAIGDPVCYDLHGLVQTQEQKESKYLAECKAKEDEKGYGGEDY